MGVAGMIAGRHVGRTSPSRQGSQRPADCVFLTCRRTMPSRPGVGAGVPGGPGRVVCPVWGLFLLRAGGWGDVGPACPHLYARNSGRCDVDEEPAITFWERVAFVVFCTVVLSVVIAACILLSGAMVAVPYGP